MNKSTSRLKFTFRKKLEKEVDVGFSYLEDDSTGRALYEPLVMFGAIVGLEPDIALQIPKTTRSYRNLDWTPIDKYVNGVRKRSVAQVIPSASPNDELEVCVRGLCNATSSAIVDSESEIWLHLRLA